MAENLECSRIGVQFGNDFEGDGKSFLKASVVVSKEEADSQISNLQSQTGNSLDYNYALVLGINSLPENIEKLHTFLKDLFGAEGLAAQLVGGKAEFKSTVSNGKVWVSLKPAAEVEEMVLGPLGFVLQNGLDVVAQTQKNSVEVNLNSSREPIDVITLIKNGDSPASALLDSARLEVKLSINKDLPESLKNSLSAIDPSISSSPLMFFLQYFKTLDVDLRFGSTSELPDQFRKYLLNKKTHLGESTNPMVQEFITLADGEVEVYATIPEFAAVKVIGRAHQISGLLHAVVEAQANL